MGEIQSKEDFKRIQICFQMPYYHFTRSIGAFEMRFYADFQKVAIGI